MRSRRHRPVLYAGVAVAVAVMGLAAVRLLDDWRRDQGSTSAADRRPILGLAPNEVQPIRLAPALDRGVPVGLGPWADPFVLVDGDVVYAYATNVEEANIPVSRTVSADVAEYLGDALPTLPTWTKPGAVWAPSVYPRPDGSYVMFYNSLYGLTGRQCVSRAVATSPGGPFVDDSTSPFVCPLDLGGAIDPSMTVVDGRAWLVYKSDGNCCSRPTSIWSVPLTDDLMALDGSPTRLISDDQPWEDAVVEAPEMLEVDGTLYLFYSGNDWSTADYAIGYAVCETMTGPCTKPLSGPFHSSTTHAKGPGGETFIHQDDTVLMAYHGWLPGHVDVHDGVRVLYVGELTFDGTAPAFTSYE